jgi:hypothetical protein
MKIVSSNPSELQAPLYELEFAILRPDWTWNEHYIYVSTCVEKSLVEQVAQEALEN